MFNKKCSTGSALSPCIYQHPILLYSTTISRPSPLIAMGTSKIAAHWVSWYDGRSFQVQLGNELSFNGNVKSGSGLHRGKSDFIMICELFFLLNHTKG
jgi:hypothetical protein